MYVMSMNRGRAAGRKLMLAAVTGAASLAILIVPSQGQAATTISTVGAYEAHPAEFFDFGDPNTATYGEVVTVPTGEHALSQFSFYLKEPTALKFRAYVYAWAAGKATGPALYEGPDLHTTDGGVFQPITANAPNTTVAPGQQYVLFFSISKDQASDEGTTLNGGWGWAPEGSYSEGELVFINNGYRSEEWTSGGWAVLTNQSFAFSATFANPPSISSVAPTLVSAGSQVKITGTELGGATQVLFGATPASSFKVEGEDQITALAPSGVTGNVDVRVITPEGTSPTVAGDQVTYAVTVTPPSPPISILSTISVKCVVPTMRGLQLVAVEKALAAAHCALGTTSRHYSTLAKGGLVEQSLHQGTVAPAGAKIDVWLSRGVHPRHHARGHRG